MSYSQIAREKKDEKEERKFKYVPFLFALGFLFLSACIGLLSYYFEGSAIPQIELGWPWLNVNFLVTIASLAGYLITAILGIIGILTIVMGVLGEFEFPKSRKFVLPKEVASTAIGPEHLFEMREYIAATETKKEDTG